MKVLVMLSLVVLGMCTVPYAAGQREADRPPGVADSDWIAINENLGIVLVPEASAAKLRVRVSPQALLLAPPANGYFMIRKGGQWSRLVIVEPLRGPADAG
jgi:hypothetical protein